MSRTEAIEILNDLAGYEKTIDLIQNYSVSVQDALHIAIASLETDEAYQLEYERTTKNDLGVDCVPRIEVIDYLCKHCPDDGECFKDCDEIKHLRHLPSVTPQEPKTGNWIEDAEQHHVEKTYHCSECGHKAWGEYEKTEYCGGCGAKMVESQESGGKE